MSEASDALVLRERVGPEGAVLRLTLNRPSKKNALSLALMSELEAAALELADDAQTRAVVVRGAGSDFSAGADLGDPPVSPEDPLPAQRRGARRGARLMRALVEIPQPTVCALRGVAAGGAACIATACDFRIAAQDARVGYPEVKLGMNLMWNALPLCTALVGPARAKRMLMRGELHSAEELLEWGFVDECVTPDALDAAALREAEALAALPPAAVQMIKESVNATSGALSNAVVHMDADQWLLTSRSEEFRERIGSFLRSRGGPKGED